jgi:hypothetical protein
MLLGQLDEEGGVELTSQIHWVLESIGLDTRGFYFIYYCAGGVSQRPVHLDLTYGF